MTAIACSGHQELSPEIVRYVQPRIRQLLEAVNENLTGVCALAAGADQVFAESVLAVGGDLRVIIPSDGYESTFENPRDLETYQSLLEQAHSVEEVGYREPGEQAFLAAGRRAVEISDTLVAVWDGQPARGVGGTADVVAIAKEMDRQIVVIWPPGAHR